MTTSTLSITTSRIGRRTYIRGATYPIRDTLRNAGAHWDADEKAWWIGDDAKAQAIATAHAVPVTEAPAPASTPTGAPARMVLVTGNTYPVKDALRAMGGRWNGTAKGWEVPAAKEAEARALVASAPVQPKASGAKYEIKAGMVTPTKRSNWRPCGYPGCSPNFCDECDGEGYVPASNERRRGRYGRRW